MNKWIGWKYCIIHFCIEVVCFWLLCYRLPLGIAWGVSLLYDIIAFAPQGLFGAFITKYKGLPYESFGHIFMLVSIPLIFSTSVPLAFLGYASLAVGNAILHVCGAISTVADGGGKAFPSALFVGGGALGVITGRTLGASGLSPVLLVLPLFISQMLCLTSKKSLRRETYPEYHQVNVKIKPEVILTVALLVTAVRSFIGYAIPIYWKKELWQDFFLFAVMGAGKAIGGLLIDKIGIRRTAVIGTLFAIPFLMLGGSNMVVSCIGVFFFSLTMSVTFVMCLSCIKKSPGIAFGITTVGLLLGTLPALFLSSIPYEQVFVCVLSLLSFALLFPVLKKSDPLLDDFYLKARD